MIHIKYQYNIIKQGSQFFCKNGGGKSLWLIKVPLLGSVMINAGGKIYILDFLIF